ncbi:interferon-inducible GTPase 5-like [Leucoraja erinacea]|uniref:interferon-inducible GTPase 5-like n=1 Tax=Leucoraja erinaceus TaxID=7782 RepID=UPI002456B41E|nr:interferon-inducible GTPase 5-like [Leucoraja erinacea]
MFICFRRETMASSSQSGYFSQQEINKLQTTYDQGGLSEFATQIGKKLNDIENAKLNIAVTGETGAGKSTFINAMRGLRGCDEGAAKIGNIETTMERTPYKHPTFPNVCFWDMPGVGSLEFPMNDYVSKMEFTTYDFFIIISQNRFTENDANVAKEIQNLGKKFYFVRSQIDNAFSSSERQGVYFDRMTELDKMKQNISCGLTKAGISKPIIFLISSLSLNEFHFPQLRETLLNNLDKIKKDVLLMSLPNTTVKIVELKRAQLKERIWMLATVSAAVGVLPVPGLTVAVNLGILVAAIIGFRKSLGLDDASLQRLANVTKKPVEFLKAEVRTPLMDEINKEFVTKMLLRPGFAAVSAVEMVLDPIPIIGSIFGAASSFAMISKLLTDVLDDLVENAQRVVTVAFATDPGHPQ